MSFQFVDNTAIDGKTRKLIRSHAAKGKNAGKGRHQRRSLQAQEQQPKDKSNHVTGQLEPRDKDQEDELALERPWYDAVSLLGVRFNLTPRNKNLFTQVLTFVSPPVYPDNLQGAICLDLTSSMWFQFIFIDEAYFHCIVATFNASANSVILGGDDSAEMILHLSRTFQLINKKLSGNEATADTTFAAVVAMTQYERLKGDYKKGLVHLDGLERLTNLRGGIRELAKKRPALAKKVFRADLEFAFYLGTPTKFHYTDVQSENVKSLLGDTTRNPKKSPLPHLLPDLQEVLQSVQAVATLINTCTHSPAMIDGNIFHEVLNFLGYRMVSINTLASPPLDDDTSNLLLLGLYCFVITFLVGLNRKLPALPLLCQRIKAATIGPPGPSDSSHEVLIWTLLISRTTVLCPSDDTWILPKVHESIEYLGITDSDQLHKRLSKLPWIGVLHNHICKRLYTMVTQRFMMPPMLGI